ncbi:hypothetical protein [Chryseobacterium pennae]|nr:hypothetical protein [Chryseobacterium pennae]
MKKYKLITFFIFLLMLYSCATKMDYFEIVNDHKDKVELSVISSLKHKEFILIGTEDNQEKIYLMLNKGKSYQMVYNEDRKAFIFNLRVGDYNFYRNMVGDPIFVKLGDQKIKFNLIQR